MIPSATNDFYIIVDVDNPLTHQKISYTFKNPVEIIKADQPDEIISALDKIDQYASLEKYLCGYFSYEAGRCIRGLSPSFSISNSDLPLIWFAVFDKPVEQNHEAGLNEYYLSDLRPAKSLEQYEDKFQQIKQHISNGLVYQINYTFPVYFSFYGDPVGLFYDLKESQKSSYNFMLSLNEKKILSLSPELFFYKNKNKIWTKPMKGTIARNHDPVLDRINKEKLRDSPKNQAENAMITDILRNDLGMICEHGSVEVEKYLEIEEYPTLYQMTSTVSGTLKPETSYKEIFTSLFPIASVTGAPKHEAMKKISELENIDRGVYTGAIGLIQPGGEAIFNVAIRTLEIDHEKGKIGIGSGIVFDSEPADEYNESLLKASFMTLNKKKSHKDDFTLFETMLFNGKRFVLLNLHMDRIKTSAMTFGMNFPEKEIIEQLQKLGNSFTGDKKTYRVKLILYPAGVFRPDEVFRIEHQPHESIPRKKRKPYRLAISNQKIHSQNIFNYHKTSLRKLQDDKYRDAIQNGYDEVVFTNENNYITECCVHNVVIKVENKWYTPDLKCGLLPGTLRRYLLNKKFLVEKLLTLDDLHQAEKIYVINSLRGTNEAVITDHYL
jgi:para-aminobenzoate synthetase/4-amino-4-deoxychorismate lyase